LGSVRWMRCAARFARTRTPDGSVAGSLQVTHTAVVCVAVGFGWMFTRTLPACTWFGGSRARATRRTRAHRTLDSVVGWMVTRMDGLVGRDWMVHVHGRWSVDGWMVGAVVVDVTSAGWMWSDGCYAVGRTHTHDGGGDDGDDDDEWSMMMMVMMFTVLHVMMVLSGVDDDDGDDDGDDVDD